jgi:coniferyl-aldehyde dehydrogenase
MNPFFFDLEQHKQAFILDPNPSVSIRRERIQRLITMLNENEENLCKVINADFGFRHPVETQLAEISAIRLEAAFALKYISQWVKPIKVKTPFYLKPTKSFLLPEPKGVVGIMSPWNYPLNLSLIPIISALAAGNSVWLKPSERSPRTSGYLATLLAQYFSPTEIHVIQGGSNVAEHFAGLPFDHLFFTGSTSVGQLVAKAAAEQLTPLTLELGGKSPVIIDTSAAIKDCAAKVLYGKLFNAGQTCIAPDYILVPHELRQAFIDALRDAYQKMYAGQTELTHPIDERQQERWNLLIEDTLAKGGQVIPLIDAENAAPNIQLPAIVLEPTSSMKIMTEEIFGPLLPIIGYAQLAEAIEFINAKPHPLAMYWFGKPSAKLDKLLAQTRAGGVTINDTLLHFTNHYLPFGGIGSSGMGSYHGKSGFDTFTHFKPVLSSKGIMGLKGLSGTKLAHPPYGKNIARLIKFIGG